jgi:hypothetical protein
MNQRRRLLKAGAAASLAGVAPLPVLAGADASRVALVIGNNAYPKSPLENAANDARAVRSLLEQAGFQVTMAIDASRQVLTQSIETFGETIRRSEVKLVVFYYAGHGAQVDWRNFLVPVDAEIGNSEDLKSRCVDFGSLLAQLKKARGKTFVVILDACRDNPFGEAVRLEQKGLSPIDAPTGTLLAYSTAPGRVAADGAGKNGLYTENLVKELSVQTTRIEDALKKVRLNVRLASEGTQIPWESTSLEDDVFIFPRQSAKLSDAELEKLFDEELAAWNRVKQSKNVAELAAYLRQYPNGHLSELAQSRLDRILAAVEAEKAAALASLAAKPPVQVLASNQGGAPNPKPAADPQPPAKIVQATAVTKPPSPAAGPPPPSIQGVNVNTPPAAAPQPPVVAAQAAPVAALPPRTGGTPPAANQAATTNPKPAVDTPPPVTVAQATPPPISPTQAARPPAPAAQLVAANPRPAVDPGPPVKIAQAAPVAEPPPRMAATTAAPYRPGAANPNLALELRAGAPVPPQLEISTANPYSAGMGSLRRTYSVGDEITVRVVNAMTGVPDPLVSKRVHSIDTDNDVVTYSDGNITDMQGNPYFNPALASERLATAIPFFPEEIQIGKKWNCGWRGLLARPKVPFPMPINFLLEFSVVSVDHVTVPAGAFTAFRLQGKGRVLNLFMDFNFWVVPGLIEPVKAEYNRRGAVSVSSQVHELVELKQKVLVAS